MTYATKQPLIDRYGLEELIQLTDRDGAGVEDDTAITRALADADAEIDGYLAGRYTLPLTPVPATLERIACVIARRRLYTSAVPEDVRADYDDAVKYLTAVGKGQINLGATTGGEQAKPRDAAEFASGGNVWDRSDTSFI